MLSEIVETERLILRRLNSHDVDDLWSVIGQPEVMADELDFAAEGRGYTREEVEQKISQISKAWIETGIGRWAIVRRDSEQFIGYCGFGPVTYLPELMDELEIGYRLRVDNWGQGFATEAAAAALDELIVCSAVETVVGVHTLANTASRAVLDKLGFVFEREIEEVSDSGRRGTLVICRLNLR